MLSRLSLAASVFLLGSLGVGFAACSSSTSVAPMGDGGTKDVNVSHDTGTHTEAGHVKDGGKDVAPPPADAGVGKTCGQLIACDEPCSSSACTNACFAQATGVAQGLFNVFANCIAVACPGPDASSCNTMAATGTCVKPFVACENDKTVGPADPDGGGVVVAADAGGELNCGEYTACVKNCPTDAGMGATVQCTAACEFSATPQGVALAGQLNACLATACPGDGGPCTTQGVACAGCQEQAIFAMPNVCAVPFTACEDDRSNASDGGTTPVSLEDGGVLTVTVSGIVQAASSLVVANNYLYYAAVDSNSQVEQHNLALDGGTVLLGPPTQTPAGLAVDSNNVYVWSYGSFSGKTSFNNDDGTVIQVPLNGSTAVTIQTGMEVLYDAPYLNSVTFDATHVYWVQGASGNDGQIMKSPIGSSSPTAIYSGQYIPEALATDGTNVYWANWGTFDALGASNNDATIQQGSINGGATITLATNQEAPGCIIVDGTNVYWTNLGALGGDLLPATNSGSVMQVPIGGGTLVTLASGQAIPAGIAEANHTIFWTEYGLSAPGLVVSVPVGGGTPVPLAGGLRNPFSLALAGNSLYWTNTPSSNGGGTILSLTPY